MVLGIFGGDGVHQPRVGQRVGTGNAAVEVGGKLHPVDPTVAARRDDDLACEALRVDLVAVVRLDVGDVRRVAADGHPALAHDFRGRAAAGGIQVVAEVVDVQLAFLRGDEGAPRAVVGPHADGRRAVVQVDRLDDRRLLRSHRVEGVGPLARTGTAAGDHRVEVGLAAAEVLLAVVVEQRAQVDEGGPLLTTATPARA